MKKWVDCIGESREVSLIISNSSKCLNVFFKSLTEYLEVENSLLYELLNCKIKVVVLTSLDKSVFENKLNVKNLTIVNDLNEIENSAEQKQVVFVFEYDFSDFKKGSLTVEYRKFIVECMKKQFSIVFFRDSSKILNSSSKINAPFGLLAGSSFVLDLFENSITCVKSRINIEVPKVESSFRYVFE